MLFIGYIRGFLSMQYNKMIFITLLLQMFFSTAYSQGVREIIDTPQTVIIPGGDTVFTCRVAGTVQQIQWLVNGTQLEDLDQRNGIEDNVTFGIGHLTFRNISEEFDDTTIQCIVTLTSGEIIRSNNAKLLVQGLLEAVDTLMATPDLLDSIISLTWTPPFSLDISNVDPDITGYCVGVVNSTSSLVIDSPCGISDTQYNYTVSPGSTPCDNYTFTVTPVNAVGNGTSSDITLLSSITMVPRPIANGDLVMLENSTFYYYEEYDPVSAVCYYSLDLCDVHNTSYKFRMMGNAPRGFAFQILSSKDIGAQNRFFTGTVTLTNSIGTTVSNINISTHDVQGTTYHIQDKQVTVTIDYIRNTEALGALLALMYLDQDGNIVCSQSIYAAIRRSEDAFTFPMGDLAITNSYTGLAYDIERNGLEDTAYPAVWRDVHDIGVISGSNASSSSCTVTYVGGTASVSCVDSTSSGYQVILQQDNDPYNLIVVNVRPGEKQTVPVVPSGRYCTMEVSLGEHNGSKVQYSREFTAEETATLLSTGTIIGIAFGVIVVMFLFTIRICCCLCCLKSSIRKTFIRLANNLYGKK